MTAFPPVTVVTGVPVPLLRDNVDTDAIIPSREINSVGKTGLAGGLFAAWRYVVPLDLPPEGGGSARVPDPAFVLNDPRFAGSPVLLAGENFGCGSSREHAVWALHEYGFRVVIARGFAPIFAANAVRGGLLLVTLADAALLAADGRPVTIDLAAQTVVQGERAWAFAIGDEAKAMLLGGLDAIDVTLAQATAIAAFRKRDRRARPWVYEVAS